MPLIPKTATEDLAKLVATVPGAKASFYEGIGHSPFWEDAPRFNRELIEFVNGIK